MKSTLFLTAVLLVAAPATFAGAQDDPPAAEPAPTKDEACAEYLKEAGKSIGKQTEEEARAAVLRLVEIWKDPEVDEGVKKPIPGLLEKYAKGADFRPVQIAAIEGLAELGPEEGAKPLLGILDKELDRKEPSTEVWVACFKGLGKLADPGKKTVGALVDYLKHKDYQVISRSAEAMAGYAEAPGKVRRELFEELLKVSEGIYSSTENEPKRKWNEIGGNVMKALRALSQGKGQFNDPGQARAWFNDTKKDKEIWS